jgi:S-adenosylmethionine decarboxylase
VRGGGLTGLYLLTESHLACHTYPESGTATFNLYCCRPRPCWNWEEKLRTLLGATRVVIRSTARGEEGGRA